MDKKNINNFQLSVLLIGFIFGSSTIMNPAAPAKSDAWLAYLLGWILGALSLTIYVLIIRLNPGKNLVEILKINFGSSIGNVISFIYVWYFIHLASMVLRNFGEYMSAGSYPQTPIYVLIASFALVIIYAVRSNLEVIARISEILVPILLFITTFTFIMAFTHFDFGYLRPFLDNGLKPVINSAFAVFSFPFGEIIVFLMVFPSLNNEGNIFKASYIAYLIVGLDLFLITVRDLLILGPDMITRLVFPPEVSIRLIEIADLDPVVGTNLMIGGGIKVILCIYAAVQAINSILNVKDYRLFVFPISFIAVSLSVWLYDNLLDMIRWAENVYPYYSLPFQVFIPVLILIISLIKSKLQIKTGKSP